MTNKITSKQYILIFNSFRSIIKFHFIISFLENYINGQKMTYKTSDLIHCSIDYGNIRRSRTISNSINIYHFINKCIYSKHKLIIDAIDKYHKEHK